MLERVLLRVVAVVVLCAAVAATRPIRSGSAVAVALSQDGKLLAVAGLGMPLRLFQVGDGKETRTLAKQSAWFGTAAFAPEGKGVVSVDSNNVIRLFPLEGEARAIGSRSSGITSLSLASDGKTLAFGGLDGKEKAVRLVEVSTGRELRRFPAGCDLVWSVALSPDGTRLAASSEDETVRAWETATGRELLKVVHSRRGVAFSPDGKSLALGGSRVHVLEVPSGKELRSLETPEEMCSVAWSADGKWLAAGGRQGTIQVWGFESWKDPRLFKGHKGEVTGLAFTPDGKALISGGSQDDRTVRWWDVQKGVQIRTLDLE